jgi:CRISPR/Cas system-associated exonuclease Cas4 (RecB family)
VTDLVLSASSVDTYRKCAYRWYLQYIERIEGDQNVRAAVGLAIHKGAETYLVLKRLGIPHEVLAGELYDGIEEAHDEMLLEELWSVSNPDEPIEKAIVQSRRTLRSYIEDVAVHIEPLIEPEVAIEATINGIPYSGHLDVADEDVHDIKIKVAKPRFTDDYAFQQTGYGILYRVATGQVERDVVLDFMVRLKRDRPYHYPIRNGGPIDDQDIRYFATILTRVADGISKGEYPPKGIENGACRYCPVTAYCQPYQETFNATSQDEDPGFRGGVDHDTGDW